jgi:cell division protein FtsI (penicillin-binding protein 3)
VSQPIQQLLEQELQRTVKAHKAKSGTVVVLNTRNGAILAMASTPSSVLDSTGQTPVSHPAVTEASTPGSVIAPFLVAAALEVGEVTPLSRKFDTGPGWLNIGNKRIGYAPPNQKVNVSKAIETSNHVVFAQLALNLDRKHYAGLLDKAGFGRLPGTGLTGEVAGQLTPYETWHPIDMAQAGYGQNMTASLLQLARTYGAIANDGVMLPISAPAEGVPPTTGNPVMLVKVARQLRKMMESVTSPNGTAPLARINGYRVAGKTSTTSKPA